jgi:hypothetical protein
MSHFFGTILAMTDPEQESSKARVHYLKRVEGLSTEAQVRRLAEVNAAIDKLERDKQYYWDTMTTVEKVAINRELHSFKEERGFLIEVIGN